MALRLREYWFGWLLGGMVSAALLFVLVVAAAPHNDARMRGFAPCTYRMAADLNEAGAARNMSETIAGVGRGYACYAAVIGKGAVSWFEGKQPAPWSNYMFEAETAQDIAQPDEVEPFSEDLIKANLLDEEENPAFMIDENVKENENE